MRQEKTTRQKVKNVLHMHSNMSTMDATNKVGDLVAQAKWGTRPSQLRIMAAPKRFLMPMLQVKSRR